MYIRCPKCKGAKQLMGMGCIYKDCDQCKGVGMVKEITSDPKRELTGEDVKMYIMNEPIVPPHCPVGEVSKEHIESRNVKKKRGGKNG